MQSIELTRSCSVQGVHTAEQLQGTLLRCERIDNVKPRSMYAGKVGQWKETYRLRYIPLT